MKIMHALRSRVVGWTGIVLAGAVALSGCGTIYDVPLPGGADVGSNPIKVHVLFRDVLDLVPQSTVKVNDVTVGKITSIKLKGYTADVTVELAKDVDLPDNAEATIQQTSLLGEKFVALSAPAQPSSGKLGTGDVIGLSHSGRNPEVEEVLGALAALLSGGGVGQLKVIAEQLNHAIGGREQDVRSVLDQLHFFMGQLAQNKTAVVGAIDNLNRLAGRLRAQDSTIKLALDNIPAALASVDKQRTDLVRMLNALNNLSNVGVKVIRASKEATINSLRDLSPVLYQLAQAGRDFPESLQVALTYPFVDEAVGRDPQVARNLHMGDFTNLSIRIDIADILKGGIPGLPNMTLGDLIQVCNGANPQLGQLCTQLKPLVNALCGLPGLGTSPICLTPGTSAGSTSGTPRKSGGKKSGGLLGGGGKGGDLGTTLGDALGGLLGGSKQSSKPTTGGSSGGGSTGSSGGLGGLLQGLGLGRAAPGASFRTDTTGDPFGLTARGYDTGISTLLIQGALT